MFVLLLLVGQGGELPGLRSDLEALGWVLRPGWLASALAIGTANLFLMGWVWIGLFRALGGEVGAGEGMRVWMVTNLGRYIPGKLWQLSGLALYMRERQRAGAAALTAAALFQLLVLGTGVAVAAITLGAEFLRGGAAVPIALTIGLLLAVLLRPSITGRISRALARRFGEQDPGAPPAAGSLWLAAVGLIAAWLVNGVGLWCVWRGAGGGVDPGVLTMAGIFSAAYVTGYLVLFAPGGLVVREGAMAALLAASSGVPLSVGAAVALLARLWAVATELLGAMIAWGAHAVSRRRAAAEVSVGRSEKRGEG